MNFSGISDKSLIGKILRAPTHLIPPNARVPIMQGRLRGKRWIVGSSTHGCWLGSYEYEKRRLFEKLLKPGSVFYDVGAHVGFYSLLGSVLVGAEGSVYSFEPFPDNLVYLREHLRLNHLANVKVIEAAVSDRAGAQSFRSGRDSSTGKLCADGDLTVRTLTLDGFIAEGRGQPDCVKIDVEGAEVRVLQGAYNLLKNRKPTVLLATHSPALHSECCEILQSCGYRLRAVSEGESLEDTDDVLAY